MGKYVNVVRSDGTVVTVPTEDAERITATHAGRPQTDQERQGNAIQEANAQASSGVEQGAATILEGVAEGYTGGLYGKGAEYLDPDYAEKMRNRAQNNPGLHLAGELGSMLLPGPSMGNAAVRAGEGVEGVLAGRLINPLTRSEALGVRAAGKFTEGAIVGTGSYIAGTNVSGDPVTVEGALESATISGVLNAGLDRLGGAISRSGARAGERITDYEKFNSDVDIVKDNAKLFGDSPGYNSVRESYEAMEDQLAERNREVASTAKEYGDAVQPNSVAKVLKGYKKAHNEVLSDLSSSEYGRQASAGQRAYSRANREYEKARASYDGFINDTRKLPKALSGMQKAINAIGERVGLTEDDLVAQLSATKAGLDGGATMGEISAEAGPSMAQEAKDFTQRLSRIAKQISGSKQGAAYDLGVERWVGGEGVGDVDQAMAELHQLRDDLGKYTFIEKPNLPDIPVAPPAPEALKVSDYPDAESLVQTAMDMDDSINKARNLAGKGFHPEALTELRALEGRVRQTPGLSDLELPEIPEAPSAPISYKAVSLPKTLREFARKTPQDIAELSNNIGQFDKGEVRAAFSKLADELGLPLDAGAADIHAGMQDAFKALDRLKVNEASEKGKGFGGWLRQKLKWGAKFAASRAFDVGGPLGAITRIVGGEAFGAVLDKAEESVLNGTLIEGKKTIGLKLNQVWQRMESGGARLQKLSPIASYLAAKFPSGEPDPESDPRKQANNRIGDFIAASQYANDAAFLALEPILGTQGDVGGKMHDAIRLSIGHMAAAAPKDPGLDVTPHGSNWLPSHEQSVEYAHRIEAVVDPIGAIERTVRGEGHPAATETLWTTYPGLMAALTSKFAENPREMSYEEGAYVSQLFKVPMTGLQQPLVATALQGLYLPRPQPQGAPSGGGGGVGGRPAKVNTQVAGSNVSGLIS